MATKIVTKNSSTAGAAPTATDLVQGELAVNVADKRLYTEDNAGAIVELGTNPSTIDINAGTIDGATVGASSASTGAFTTLTATGAFTSRGIDDNADATAITIDSSENVGIGTSSSRAKLDVSTGTSTSSDAVVIGPTSGTATVNDVIRLGFALQNTAGGGTANTYGAAIGGIQDKAGSNSGALGFYTQSSAGDGTPERMRIDSSGNVGIGTQATGSASSKQLLSLVNPHGNTGAAAQLWLSGTNATTRGTYIEAEVQSAGNDHDLIFATSASGATPTERMRIDSSGKVGIGTSSPLQGLHLNFSNSLAAIRFQNAANDKVWDLTPAIPDVANSGFSLHNVTDNTVPLHVDNSGNVGIGVTPSAWGNGWKAMEFGFGSFGGYPTSQLYITSNAYNSGTGWIYNTTSQAAQYLQYQGAHVWSSAASGTAGTAATITNKMTLDASGNLLVGTTSFGGSGISVGKQYGGINLAGSGGTFANWGGAYGIYPRSNVGLGIASVASMSFETGGGNERMRIDSSGSSHFGRQATGWFTAGISLVTGGSGYSEFIRTHPSDASSNIYMARANNGSMLGFFRNDGGSLTAVGSISVTASATAYNTSSDYRLKEDDVPMTGATERIKALRPINFAWKADGSRVDGFFAHELAEVVPEATTGTKDAMKDEEYEVTAAIEEVRDEDDNITTEAVEAVMGTRSVPDMQGIDQSKLVPLLTATIQELIARIEALENGE